MIQDWYFITSGALKPLVEKLLVFIPDLIGALLIFTIGWFVANIMGKFVVKVLDSLKINQLIERGGWKEALEKADVKVNVSEFMGAIVKWIFVIAFLSAAVQVLGLTQFGEILNGLISWLPKLLVASIIIVVAVIVADILEKIIRAWVEQMKIGYGSFIGTVVRWMVWFFAILAVLEQLDIAISLVNAVVQGMVAVFVISFGIAFGLGGKDIAAEILRDAKNKFKK